MEADKDLSEGTLCRMQGLDSDWVARLVDSHSGRLGGLIGILQDVQAECGYLPETALRMVGKLTGHSLVDIYGVATFHRNFRMAPRGRHVISVCQGTACHVRGAVRPLEELERLLAIKSGQTTPDGRFSLEAVNCLGACALGPVIVVDGTYYSHVGSAKVRRILDRLSREQPGVRVPARAT